MAPEGGSEADGRQVGTCSLSDVPSPVPPILTTASQEEEAEEEGGGEQQQQGAGGGGAAHAVLKAGDEGARESYYNRALEELAAMGMSEHPEEVRKRESDVWGWEGRKGCDMGMSEHPEEVSKGGRGRGGSRLLSHTLPSPCACPLAWSPPPTSCGTLLTSHGSQLHQDWVLRALSAPLLEERGGGRGGESSQEQVAGGAWLPCGCVRAPGRE